MTPEDALTDLIRPVLKELGATDPSFATDEAALFLLAVALQESGLAHRRQLVKGVDGKLYPRGRARGLWQFELLGVQQAGCNGPACCDALLRGWNPVTMPIKQRAHLRGEWITLHKCLELEKNDRIACLLAATLPKSLHLDWPKFGDEDEAWRVYLRAWRPGAPHRERWTRSYATARKALEATKGLTPSPDRV